MKMGSFTAVVVTIVMAATAGGCAFDVGTQDDVSSVQIHGLQEHLAYDELAARADLAVIATATSESTQKFSDNAAIPVSSRDELGYENSTFTAVTLTVTEVLAGELSANEVDVARLETLTYDDGLAAVVEGNDHTELSLGETYVLFLTRGAGLWAGSYLALGEQGIGVLQEEQVSFRDGRQSSLRSLREAIAGRNGQ